MSRGSKVSPSLNIVTMNDAPDSSTANTCRPSPHLPNEILYMIIRGSLGNRLACSRVSRQWRSAAIPLLFHTILFYPPPIRGRGDPTAWVAFWDQSPWIAVHVQKIWLYRCTVSLIELDSLLSCLPSLRILYLESISLRRESIRLTQCLGHTRKIGTFKCKPSSYDGSLDDLADILGLFSEIESFDDAEFYHNVSSDLELSRKAEDMIENGHHGKLQIRALNPIRSNFSPVIHPFMLLLIKIGALRSLTSLTIKVDLWTLRELAVMLSDTGKTMKNLSIKMEGGYSEDKILRPNLAAERQRWVKAITSGIAACVILEQFELDTNIVIFHSFDDYGRRIDRGMLDVRVAAYLHFWNVVVELVPSVPSPQLDSLAMKVTFWDRKDNVDDPSKLCLPWTELKNICRSLRHLKSIEVGMRTRRLQIHGAQELQDFGNVVVSGVRVKS